MHSDNTAKNLEINPTSIVVQNASQILVSMSQHNGNILTKGCHVPVSLPSHQEAVHYLNSTTSPEAFNSVNGSIMYVGEHDINIIDLLRRVNSYNTKPANDTRSQQYFKEVVDAILTYKFY